MVTTAYFVRVSIETFDRAEPSCARDLRDPPITTVCFGVLTTNNKSGAQPQHNLQDSKTTKVKPRIPNLIAGTEKSMAFNGRMSMAHSSQAPGGGRKQPEPEDAFMMVHHTCSPTHAPKILMRFTARFRARAMHHRYRSSLQP
jgi:hypothetical protein